MAKTLLLPIFLVFTLMVVLGVNSATPSPSQDCSSVILSMSDCLSFVTSGSTVKKPEGGCCSGLKSVLKTAPQCLCETFKNSGQLGISLNMTKAMTLPSACGVKSPSFTNCGLSVAPVGSPAHAPKSSAASPKSAKVLPPSTTAASPAEAPATSIADAPGTPSTGGSSQLAPGPGKSGASVVSLSLVALVSMVVASCSQQF